MKHRDKNRGTQSVHTFSCYKDTWNRFQTDKRYAGKTADEMLNILLNYYESNAKNTREKVITDFKKQIINYLKKLK